MSEGAVPMGGGGSRAAEVAPNGEFLQGSIDGLNAALYCVLIQQSVRGAEVFAPSALMLKVWHLSASSSAIW